MVIKELFKKGMGDDKRSKDNGDHGHEFDEDI
jgi:hypothetical protein